MRFIFGLALGILAGVAVGSLYTPGGVKEEVAEAWETLPPELRDPVDEWLDRIKGRFLHAQAVYRETHEETRARLLAQIKTSQTNRS